MSFDFSKRVLAALKELAKEDHSLSVNELRVVLALERAVVRLQKDSMLSEHLVFKGGFVLLKEHQSKRFTREADALAIDISKDLLTTKVEQALTSSLDDGLWYGDV